MNNRIPEDLIERVYQGKSTKEDGLLLLETPPLELFRFADELRSLAAGDMVTYVVNRNINFTSRCVGSCGFCAFRTNNGRVLSIEEIMEKVREAERAKATEICRMIYGAGRTPKERTTLYRRIHELASRNSGRTTGCGASE